MNSERKEFHGINENPDEKVNIRLHTSKFKSKLASLLHIVMVSFYSLLKISFRVAPKYISENYSKQGKSTFSRLTVSVIGSV